MYSTLKTIHVSFAIVSIAGFILRGVWMFTNSANLGRPIVRIAPHVVDTAFLISGIWLVVILNLPLLDHTWLIAKIIALTFYIVLGTIALKRGTTIQIRAVAFVLALLAYAYIVGAALYKSPVSWIAFEGV